MSTTLKTYLDADWSRLCILSGAPNSRRSWVSNFGPRFAPVVLIRCAHILYTKGYHGFSKVFSLINFIIFNLEVPARLLIGPGLVIPHPQGTVLGAAVIGSNATIFHQVTLGGKSVDFSYSNLRRPVVGDNVTISVGAKVLGPICLGDGCLVGANAVVICDVPSMSLAVGVPAKITPLDATLYNYG